jgi:DeoR family transcriptional regulator, fructose operon transcriptional repressor
LRRCGRSGARDPGRTYGGAVANPRPIELSLREKELSYQRHKDPTATLARGLVKDGEVIIIDSATTTGRLAWHLRGRQNITVVTNGISALFALRDAEGVEVIVLGGKLRGQVVAMHVAAELAPHALATHTAPVSD